MYILGINAVYHDPSACLVQDGRVVAAVDATDRTTAVPSTKTYFQYNSHGDSSSGALPTDRPNTLKGYAYYDFKWLKKFTTDIGLSSRRSIEAHRSATSMSAEGSTHFPFTRRTGECGRT